MLNKNRKRNLGHDTKYSLCIVDIVILAKSFQEGQLVKMSSFTVVPGCVIFV